MDQRDTHGTDPAAAASPGRGIEQCPVARQRLHDARGDECLDVDLPDDLNETSAACITLAVGRCVHLIAAPHCTWTARGVTVLSWRVAGRLTFLDDVPPALADDLAAAILRHLDWLEHAA